MIRVLACTLKGHGLESWSRAHVPGLQVQSVAWVGARAGGNQSMPLSLSPCLPFSLKVNGKKYPPMRINQKHKNQLKKKEEISVGTKQILPNATQLLSWTASS